MVVFGGNLSGNRCTARSDSGAASVSSRLRITDPSMKLCNSGTFPGQLKDVIACITLAGIARMHFLIMRAKVATKQSIAGKCS
jgi:hypothetical protein